MAYSIKGTLNKKTLIGHVGSEVVLRYTQSGTAVCNFSVATSEKAGQEEITTWHRVVCWDKLAELAQKYVSKGSKVYVEGVAQTRKWKDNDGNERLSEEMDCKELIFMSKNDGGQSGHQSRNNPPQESRSSSGGGSQSSGRTEKKQESFDDEDIPF